jgi:hypothetical protein
VKGLVYGDLTVTAGTVYVRGGVHGNTNVSGGNVQTAPYIHSVSGSQVALGSTAEFSVTASGRSAPTYQWEISTNGGSTWTNLTDGAEVSGATSATLSLTSLTTTENGYQYRCVATGSIGASTYTATSPAMTLTVAGSAITNAAELKTALANSTDSFIVLGNNITVSDWSGANASEVNAWHELIIPTGMMLTFENESQMRIKGTSLSYTGFGLDIKGGGTVVLNNTSASFIVGDTAGGDSFSDVTVNINNKVDLNSSDARFGMTIEEGAVLNLNTAQGQVVVANGGGFSLLSWTNDGIATLNINHPNPQSVIAQSGSTLALQNVQINAVVGGGIELHEGVDIHYFAPNTLFNDRGTDFTGGGVITVGAASAAPSATVLSAGQYIWNGSVFMKTDPLDFTDDAAFDIPASVVGTAIMPIDVSSGASGGYMQYEFSATGLPAGLYISEVGVISGAPATASAAGCITDDEGGRCVIYNDGSAALYVQTKSGII